MCLSVPKMQLFDTSDNYSTCIPLYDAVLTLDVHVAQVKDGSEQFGDFPGVIICEHEDLQSWKEVGVFLHIITSFTAGAFTLVTGSHGLKTTHLSSESTNKDSVLFKLLQYHGQIVVLGSVPKGKNLFLLSWHAHQHVVKDVIVSFLRRLHMNAHVRYHKRIWLVPCYCSCKHSPKQYSHLTTNSGLFQQVLLNASPFNGPTLGEVDVNVLPKTTGVVISNCFGVAKGWEENYTYFIKADQVKKGDSANYDGCLIGLCKLIPSKMGFASRICCSIQECWLLTAARNCSMSLVFSVFPAPDSPLTGKSKK